MHVVARLWDCACVDLGLGLRLCGSGSGTAPVWIWVWDCASVDLGMGLDSLIAVGCAREPILFEDLDLGLSFWVCGRETSTPDREVYAILSQSSEPMVVR